MNDQIEGRPRSDSTDLAFRKIFIGGLSYSTDEEKLRKYFKSYGAVQDAVVMKDPVTKRSRGFGFITFYDVNSVDNVLANEPHTIDARKVEAKRAVPRSEMAAKELASSSTTNKANPPSTPLSGVKYPTPQESPLITPSKSLSSGNLVSPPSDSKLASDPRFNADEYAYNKIFVGGLHYDTRDPEFRSYFEKYGKVVSSEVMFNRETHKSRGFGFVIFELEEHAEKVCADKEHIIDGKVVEVKRAIPRSKMVATTVSPTSHGNKHSPVEHVQNDQPLRGRTLSGGSIQLVGSPPLHELSPTHNSGIMNLKPPSVNISNSQLPPSGQKKPPTPLSNASATTAAQIRNANGSYASALKIGNSNEDIIYLQQPPGISSPAGGLEVRPSRAYSEPIKFEGGSFGYSQDLFDINSYNNLAGNNPRNGIASFSNDSFPNSPEKMPQLSAQSQSSVNSVSWFSTGNSEPLSFASSNDFMRGRAQSLNLGTSNSPLFKSGIVGFPNFGSESLLGNYQQHLQQSPERNFSLYEKNTIFSTPSRVNIGTSFGETPNSALKSQSKMISSPEPYGGGMLSPGNQEQVPGLTGSILGLLGENATQSSNSIFADFPRSTEGSRVLGFSAHSQAQSQTGNEYTPQRRYSHPVLPSQEALDMSTPAILGDMKFFDNSSTENANTPWSAGKR